MESSLDATADPLTVRGRFIDIIFEYDIFIRFYRYYI